MPAQKSNSKNPKSINSRRPQASTKSHKASSHSHHSTMAYVSKMTVYTLGSLFFLSVYLTAQLYYVSSRPANILIEPEVESYTTSWTTLKTSSFEGANFLDWDQTNASEGTLDIVDGVNEVSGTSEGAKIVKATQNGSGNTNGHFSRTIWNLPDWNTGVIYRTKASFYLPTGFYNNMQGSVQLIGWDTYPDLNNHMRLIIYNSDKKARLFINENNITRELTNSFTISEGSWHEITIEQKLSQDAGWSKVYLNGQLVASGDLNNCVSPAIRCADTLTAYPVRRIRYGFVAISDNTQLKPLSLYFDNVSIATGIETPDTTPIVDSQSPIINITNPKNGTTLRVGRSINITTSVSDNVGVTKVQVFVNKAAVCTIVAAPYECKWTPNDAKATYYIDAVAYDAVGNTATSTVKAITK